MTASPCKVDAHAPAVLLNVSLNCPIHTETHNLLLVTLQQLSENLTNLCMLLPCYYSIKT